MNLDQEQDSDEYPESDIDVDFQDGQAFVAPMAESGRKPCTGKAVSCRVPAQTSGLILSPLLVLLVIGRSDDDSSKFAVLYAWSCW